MLLAPGLSVLPLVLYAVAATALGSVTMAHRDLA
jgi:hypothetical protein